MSRAFLCHSSADSKFAIALAQYLVHCLKGGAFYYEEHQRSDQHYLTTIEDELNRACDVFVVVVGREPGQVQLDEIRHVLSRRPRMTYLAVSIESAVDLAAGSPTPPQWYMDILNVAGRPWKVLGGSGSVHVSQAAHWILVDNLQRPLATLDGLPTDPHLFSAEKEIVDHYNGMLDAGDRLYSDGIFRDLRRKILDGVPPEWPVVTERTDPRMSANPIHEREVGRYRNETDAVVVSARGKLASEDGFSPHVQLRGRLWFPEAGPRENVWSHPAANELKVGIIVSGGIAPATNAVIDGIVQRHERYAHAGRYQVEIVGIKNGFLAFDGALNANAVALRSSQTSSDASAAGSILGTSRDESLLDLVTRQGRLDAIAQRLQIDGFDILYVIGGDGTMKAAHAVAATLRNRNEHPLNPVESRPVSVVGIPKTMDNDILWVWQSFGFISAVEKGREVVEQMSVEIRSNPRLGVIQLFGSDSGFVVSHAVLASATGHCDAALIPEIQFRIERLAEHVADRVTKRGGRIPSGLIVMAETAIPEDVEEYITDAAGNPPRTDIGLSDDEQNAVRQYLDRKESGRRIEGQTDDVLRRAALSIVVHGLEKKLRAHPDGNVKWSRLRVVTSEPRHLLRTSAPTTPDLIMGQRLGLLAVDNALAGYTDFMISNWLTEYVLVPLKLTTLGRKRIPTDGMFWRSVLSKTGQADLT
jgi:6-phosphofructokinase 1